MRLIDADEVLKQARIMASRTSLGETKPSEISGIEVIGLINDAPTVDAVHRETLAQVMWERDVAMKQLEEHGIPFGCKADVRAVKHGKWELHSDGSGTCNRCRFTQKNVWDYDSWQNYCGVCGAKMDGECE